MPSAAFLCVVPAELRSSLEQGGYALMPRTRPAVNGRGVVHVRLVWRGHERASVALCFTLRGRIPGPLLDALDLAMAPASFDESQIIDA